MPFEKGQSGNPKGRPTSRKSLSAQLRVALAQKLPDGRIANRAIADALVAKAIEGDIPAIREIMDRTEGKVTAKVNLDAEQPRPINIQLTPMDMGLL